MAIKHLDTRIRMIGAFALGVTLAVAGSARACSVCFNGDPSDPIVQGTANGVWMMIGVTYCLLLGFVGIGVTWFVRARRMGLVGDNTAHRSVEHRSTSALDQRE